MWTPVLPLKISFVSLLIFLDITVLCVKVPPVLFSGAEVSSCSGLLHECLRFRRRLFKLKFVSKITFAPFSCPLPRRSSLYVVVRLCTKVMHRIVLLWCSWNGRSSIRTYFAVCCLWIAFEQRISFLVLFIGEEQCYDGWLSSLIPVFLIFSNPYREQCTRKIMIYLLIMNLCIILSLIMFLHFLCD